MVQLCYRALICSRHFALLSDTLYCSLHLLWVTEEFVTQRVQLVIELIHKVLRW